MLEIPPMCAYVPQGNLLFSGTLRENLTIAKPYASEQELEQVIHISAMEEDEKATEDLIYVVENDTEGSLAVSAQELLDTMAEMQETADSAA